MLRLRSCGFLAATMVIAGCSIHPLPKDVSRNDTFKIVKNVRCEAKYQVINRISRLLEHSPSPQVQAIPPRFILRDRHIRTLRTHHRPLVGLNKCNHPKGYTTRCEPIEGIIRAFEASGISYKFRFEITEKNNASGNLVFRLPFTNGVANVGTGGAFGGSLKKTRLAKREFTMVENFSDLQKLKCGDNEFLPPKENYLEVARLKKRFIYPLTGSVAMDEIMDEFLRLGVLGGGKGDFTDKITFTTTKAAGINADVTLNPGPLKKFRLAAAGAATDAERKDIHEVIITLAFPNVDFRSDQQELIGPSLAAYAENAKLRAAIQQCIRNAEAREDNAGVLRLVAPEQYCVRFAQSIVRLRSGQTLPFLN